MAAVFFWGSSLQHWTVPKLWDGEPVVCIGGGPSLTAEQVNYCKGKARVIAVNDAYRLAPWADLLYACDARWWKWHPQALEFQGLKVTHSEEAAAQFGLLCIKGDKEGQGLSTDPTKIHTGRNGGYQAINIASLAGGKPILLIGYDMRLVDNKKHWFGEHPRPLQTDYKKWLPGFKTIAEQNLVEIINCTPNSALTCFRAGTLQEILGASDQARV